jgi:hypothetical protein
MMNAGKRARFRRRGKHKENGTYKTKRQLVGEKIAKLFAEFLYKESCKKGWARTMLEAYDKRERANAEANH